MVLKWVVLLSDINDLIKKYKRVMGNVSDSRFDVNGTLLSLKCINVS